MNELRHAIGAIERRIYLVRLTDDCAEFVTTTRRWVEIMAVPEGWRVRVYDRGRSTERTAADVAAAIEVARELARSRALPA